MRIIAGTKRGMKLLPPKGMTTRPITDRVKESLFSILYKYDIIEDANVADVFCGTGSMGLEAMSRGAGKVTFVDSDREVLSRLKRNIEKAAFHDRSKIIKANAFMTGAGVISEKDKCNMVFVDPPYEQTRQTGQGSQLAGLLEVLCEQLAPDAIVVVRTHQKSELLDQYKQLHTIDRREWGNMAITILTNSESE